VSIFRSSRAAYLAPYGAGFAATWVLLAISNAHTRPTEVTIALAIQIVIGVMLAYEHYWAHRRVVVIVGIVAFLASVTLLRDGIGANPGYGSLVLLPVLWGALRCRRDELALALVGCVLVLLGPIVVVGGAHYPASGWRSGGLTAVIATIIGVTVFELVGQIRANENAQRALAEERRRLQEQVEAQRDEAKDLLASQNALSALATLVATGAQPSEVFRGAATSLGELFGGKVASVVRFDVGLGIGEIIGGWSKDGEELTGQTITLAGPSATAQVFRTGAPVRLSGYVGRGEEPVLETHDLGVALCVPIMVAGQLWGTVGVAFGEEVPLQVDAEARLVTFAELVAVAISNAAAWQTLTEQATTDAVTGLANHRIFHERLRIEVRRAARHGRALSVAVFDIDHFKQVNDTYGHQTGDAVLMEVGRRLLGVAREGELVARTGGEEFAWLMPETGEEGAQVAAERGREAVASLAFEIVGKLTVSAGVSSNEGCGSAEELFSAADKALYLAKHSGRNATVVYSH
jgi:diguanylate cyclase (GGDEF)-like protein